MDADAIASRATSLTAPDPAPRKPAGQSGHITPAERLEIQTAFLTAPGATISSVARDFGRTREAIGGCVKGEAFERLRLDLWEQMRQDAVQGLRGHVQPAVQAWGTSLGIAAAAGNHKPSKELLEAVGIIERAPSSIAAVNIVIGMPGKPVGQAPVIDLSLIDLTEATLSKP